MSATVNVNGRITDDRDATISVFDHGSREGITRRCAPSPALSG
jgi:hypothetical protein